MTVPGNAIDFEHLVSCARHCFLPFVVLPHVNRPSTGGYESGSQGDGSLTSAFGSCGTPTVPVEVSMRIAM